MKKQMLNILKKGGMLFLVLLLVLMPTMSYAASSTNNSTSILEAVTKRYKNMQEYKAFLGDVNEHLNGINMNLPINTTKANFIDFLLNLQKQDYSSSSVVSAVINKLLNVTLTTGASTTPDLVTTLVDTVKNLLSNASDALKSLTPSRDNVTIDATSAEAETGNSKYNVKLNGKIYYAGASDTPTDKWVVLLHGVLMNSQAMADAVGQMYLDEGYNILAVDSRGHGDSKGSVAMGYLESLDVWDWLNFLHSEYPNKCNQIIIHGTSLGGATTVFTSRFDLKSKNVIGLIEDCGYTSLTGIITGMLGVKADTEEVTEEEATLIEKILSLPADALASIVGSPAAESLIKTLLINVVNVGLTEENFDQHQDALVGIKEKCNVPILIIHGTTDTTVPYENSTMIYKEAMQNDKIPYVQRFSAEGQPHAFVMVGNKEKAYETHVKTFIENAEKIDNGTYRGSKEFTVEEPTEEFSLISSLLKALKLIKNMLF